MGDFFKTDEKVSLDQMDVRISAENGLNFEQDQTIGIYIPPSVKYFSGRDCYLQFNALINPDINEAQGCFATRLQLDSHIGGNSLFSSMRVYSGNREVLLEENTEYPSYVGVKYDYTKNDVEQKKRSLDEGCGVWTPANRGTLGTTKSICNNFMYSPYFKTINAGAGVDADATIDKAVDGDWDASSFIPAKLTLPLHCGVFAENRIAYPNLLTNGIYIELVMAPIRNLLRQVDSVLLTRRLRLNPLFSGATADGTTWATGGAGNEQEVIFIKGGVNNVINAQTCPFVLGEKVGFARDDGDGTFTKAVISAGANGDGAVINKIEKAVDGQIKITIGRGTGVQTDTAIDPAENWFLYSLSLDQATSWQPSVKVSNVEMIVHQISSDSGYEQGQISKLSSGGVVRFDIPSVGVHTHSTLATDVQSTIPLNIDYSRAKSILCIGTDASIYPTNVNTSAKGTYLQVKDSGANSTIDVEMRSNRTGLEGCSNGLSQYSYFLNGKMIPSRPISTRKVSDKRGGIDANFMVELEKALLSFDIPTNSFEEYSRNFVLGRVLAIGDDAVFDGRGMTARLNCAYEGAVDDQDKPSVNLLWKIFTRHVKTLVIRNGNVQVEM
tara:strand:+ start:11347 stop:13176 length:1830 start_codon:yes stop_codon:yes gene_type:complete